MELKSRKNTQLAGGERPKKTLGLFRFMCLLALDNPRFVRSG